MPTLTLPALFPRLVTNRLILREIIPADREAIFLIYSDELVTDTLEISPLKFQYEAEDLISGWKETFEHQQGIRWGIIDHETSRLIGTCGFKAWYHSMRGEICYDLGRECWGQGLMSEALQAVLTYGFEEVGLNRVEALVNPRNDRSIHMLTRTGFQREGVLREYGYWKGRYWDQVCYSMLHREWQGTTASQEGA